MDEPIRGKLSKDKFNRIDKRQFKVSERKGSGMGVVPYFGAKVNGWEGAVGLDPDIMTNISTEWGDEGNGVVVKVGEMGK